MSFTKIKDIIEYGDVALLHIGYDNMLPIVVTKGETKQTKFGALKHDRLVGKRFGTRFQCRKGWLYVIHPTPELWTLSLPHRTQILYSTDISMVIFQLDIKPGSIVIEAGTGSGSLSHAILRAIQPSGHLHTFEFHQERSIKAREEFSMHGLGKFVTVTQKDVCGEGFNLDNIADAVFLDLPRPWECVESAKNAMKREGGRICTFSPCIEQVQRGCEELANRGFTNITTMECLCRNYHIQFAKLQNLHFGSDPINGIVNTGTSDVEGCADDGNQVTMKGDEDEGPAVKMTKSNGSPTESTVQKSNEEKSKANDNIRCFPTAVPTLAMQGHTGFLTFATLLPF